MRKYETSHSLSPNYFIDHLTHVRDQAVSKAQISLSEHARSHQTNRTDIAIGRFIAHLGKTRNRRTRDLGELCERQGETNCRRTI